MNSTVLIETEELLLKTNSRKISTTIKQGEILGLAGLEGHGAELFLKCLCGLAHPISGRITYFQNKSRNIINNYHSAVKAGIVYMPKERKTEGILPMMSVLDNFSLPTFTDYSRLGFINYKKHQQDLKYFTNMLSMIYKKPSALITSLSGGNKQKVLIARWLASNPNVICMNDPTRGVDLTTKNILYKVFMDITKTKGITIVLLSTDLEEIVQVCSRSLVFREFNIIKEISGSAITRKNLISAMFGRTND